MARPKHVPGPDELRLLAELEFRRDLAVQTDARRVDLVRLAHAEGATIEALCAASGWGHTKVENIISAGED